MQCVHRHNHLKVAEAERIVAKQIVLATAVGSALRLLRLDVVVARWRDAVGLHGGVVWDVTLELGLVALGGCGVVDV